MAKCLSDGNSEVARGGVVPEGIIWSRNMLIDKFVAYVEGVNRKIPVSLLLTPCHVI